MFNCLLFYIHRNPNGIELTRTGEPVEVECDNDDSNLTKRDDIYDMLFDLQNANCNENDFEKVEVERENNNQAEINLEEMNVESVEMIEQSQMEIDASLDGNQTTTEPKIELEHTTIDYENIQIKNETIFGRNQTKTENDMETQNKSSNQEN